MGSLIFDEDPIGSLIFDVLNGKPASASRAPHHIVELWMLSDETGDEGAFGDHFEPLPADDLERALRQARADAFAGKRGRHLGVGERDGSGRAAIIGNSRMTVGVELEAAALRVVADLIRHGRLPSRLVGAAGAAA